MTLRTTPNYTLEHETIFSKYFLIRKHDGWRSKDESSIDDLNHLLSLAPDQLDSYCDEIVDFYPVN